MTRPEPKVETVTATDRPSVSINAPTSGWGSVGVDTPQAAGAPVMDLRDVSVYYGNYEAVRGTSMPIRQHQITAMIGPSGCGKSTILRSLNRMNDLIPGARVAGKVTYHGQDLYAKDVDPIQVRRRIGMVFQKPNPFPKSIFDNVAYGLRINGIKGNLHDQVEEALTGAALWDEVKDKLKTSGLALSGGQQQRLCIARTIAVRPDVILMDEPCSALDPIATGKIEDLMHELAKTYTIVIVTHNMQQAARVSHYTAFFTAEVDDKQVRHGRLVEFSETGKLFTNPSDKRTEDYITGRFG
ncbi:phosphate ABC transporter ATP-binding protein PstB [Phytohabitans houttuyneae]|uniref:Phosphate import ATP-binding protein PstB n=1 Tax=Phytohabitans houttuyneae TaxID=1076126 RepID=A0A6V8K959_9ACTN|nr:phosphate ABC transporter ATP-binding protein PstB [Phytohabitans houttuyneae]GFJ80304.1 phosphate import ATP-binding protein PstB [Phytohabitans houttuyneae]